MVPRSRRSRIVPLGFLAFALPGCIALPTDATKRPDLGDADTRILFVGNSLTSWNNLPVMVATVAEVMGYDVSVASISAPNYSLEEHWKGGIGRDIRAIEPDVVVMQQGPSSLPQNQIHLRTWADSMNIAIRSVDAVPVLYMVWPDQGRLHAFDAVRDAYQGAAESVDGVFAPAGEAWRTAWAEDPTLAFFGPDGFHPSRLGSLVAAATIVRSIFGDPVSDLPSSLVPSGDDRFPIHITEEVARIIYPAVDATVEAWGSGGSGG